MGTMWAASTRTRDKMNECERERQPFESTTLCRPFRMCVCSGATALIKHRVCTLGRCSRDSEAVFVACNASVTYSRLSKNLHGCHQDKTHLRRLRRPPSHRRWMCGRDAGRSQWRLGVSARCVFRVSGSQMLAPTSAVEKRHQGPGTIGTVDKAPNTRDA